MDSLGLGAPMNFKLFLKVFCFSIHPAAHTCPPPPNCYAIVSAIGGCYVIDCDDLSDNLVYLFLLFMRIARFSNPNFTDKYDKTMPKSLMILFYLGSVPKHLQPLYFPLSIMKMEALLT